MEWKGRLTRTPYLVLFVVLLSVGVGTASALITITLSGNVVITGDLDMTSDKIRNVGTPTVSSDVATKGYVDSAPSTDTLALLGCTFEEIPQWDGTQWVCSNQKIVWNSNVPKNNTITVVDSSDDVGLFTSIAIGVDGFPVISYYDTTNDDLKVAKCVTPDCASSIITTVDSAGNTGAHTALAIGTDGNPVVSYRDVTNGDLKVAKCNDMSCSSSTISTVDSADDVGLYTSITIGLDGFPRISYYDQTNGDLKIATCNNSSCSSSTLYGFSHSNNMGLHTSISVSTDGILIISAYDATDDNAKLFSCVTGDCSEGLGFSAISEGGGQFSSMTLNEQMLPIFSHTSGSILYVTSCSAYHCGTQNTISIVDYVGEKTSIAIGVEEKPIISYYESDNQDLVVVPCLNSDCSGTLPKVLDSNGNVGAHSSTTVGLDGLPVISYRDVTNGDLKVVKCGNPYCVPNWTRR
jgi:hypothetical protein